ncbi:MAG: hydrogenase maturation protease [Candidatus Hydrogenedens sp.]|nr:hydrogenase maturation protease [Candidatus Hydrogenedens sp.]
MNVSEDDKILIFGYGNPGRHDDVLGHLFVQRIQQMTQGNIDTDADYQLNVELAAELANYDKVIFVDATKEGEEPFYIKRVFPSKDITFTTHSLNAESVVAICDEYFGSAPETWMLGIRGYDFTIGEGITEEANDNLELAWQYLNKILNQQRRREHGTKESYSYY